MNEINEQIIQIQSCRLNFEYLRYKNWYKVKNIKKQQTNRKPYLNPNQNKMILEQNQQTQPHQMNQLMYKIQTKLSLLSQIQKSAMQKGDIHQSSEQMAKKLSSEQLETQINLPMQMLNRKMEEIMNEKSPSSEHRANGQANQKTFEKKRLQLNQLQTATRNIDQIKRNQLSTNLHVKQPKPKTDYSQPQQQNVRQFNTNHHTDHSMTQSMLNSGSKSSSRILNKFNQIEINYTEKIKSLTFKVSFLEQRLSQTEEEKKEILESLETYKLLYSRKQEDVEKEIEKRLEEIKEKLIEKFAQECRLKYNEYITELKDCTQKLNEQRKRRKFFEEQNKVFRLEKENYEQMYKSLAKKQKQWLKLDIDQTRNQILSNSSNYELSAKHYQLNQGSYSMMGKVEKNEEEVDECSQIEKITEEDNSEFLNKQNVIYNTKSNYLYQKNSSQDKYREKLSLSKSKEKSLSKSKQKSMSKKSDSLNKKSIHSQHQASKSKRQIANESMKSNTPKKSKKTAPKSSSEMTKDELIPFLAKGIEQLKQRLKMK